MPKLLAKTEGSGNGIKTNILNISEVASEFPHLPAAHGTHGTDTEPNHVLDVASSHRPLPLCVQPLCPGLALP